MKLQISALALVAALASTSAASAADAPSAAQLGAMKKLVASGQYKTAVAKLTSDYDRIVADLITLTEIPAPPFKEQTRAKAYMEMLKAHGLSDVEMDAEGNVMGLRRGTGPAGGPLLVVTAHLDTVFPEGTDVKVRREGAKLSAPGIGDDTASLAVDLGLIRAMDAAKIKTKGDILFMGNVG
ncbi:MAG: peptidase, partial [Phenylobacterium sp.]|nr:peptidase [Phenylobacterium sp.]